MDPPLTSGTTLALLNPKNQVQIYPLQIYPHRLREAFCQVNSNYYRIGTSLFPFCVNL